MSLDIRQMPSPNFTKGRGAWKPDMIVCHISEGSYESGCEWLCNPASGVSAHFFVGKLGQVTQLVDIADTAWSNATSSDPTDNRYYGCSKLKTVVDRKVNANNYTVAIEHEGVYAQTRGALTDAQLNATTELIAKIIGDAKARFGVTIPLDREHIVGHCELVPKWKPNCPGEKFPYDEIIRRLQEMNAPETSVEKRYNRVEEMPDWAKAPIQKLIDSGALAGDTNGDLGLSLDMMRILVIIGRMK